MMKMTALVLCWLMLFPSLVQADSEFMEDDPRVKYGTLKSNQVWQGDIYLVGDVIIPQGIELIIEPGTRLYFAEYDITQAGDDPQQTEIIVQGVLQAKPSEDNPILVTTIGELQWKSLKDGNEKSIELQFKPYLIDTEPMREEFHQFKKQYLILWTLIYTMWILAI